MSDESWLGQRFIRSTSNHARTYMNRRCKVGPSITCARMSDTYTQHSNCLETWYVVRDVPSSTRLNKSQTNWPYTSDSPRGIQSNWPGWFTLRDHGCSLDDVIQISRRSQHMANQRHEWAASWWPTCDFSSRTKDDRGQSWTIETLLRASPLDPSQV
jgi:hypothetical protein